MKQKRPGPRKEILTPFQQRFIDFYDGNGVATARKAGYKGDTQALGVAAYKLLKLPKIKKLIEKRDQLRNNPHIMSRQERQEFWSSIAKDLSKDIKDRLKASELLGRSECDFVEKREISGSLTLEKIIADSVVAESE